MTTTGQGELEYVATFDLEHEAQLARTHLEGAEIAAWIERIRGRGAWWTGDLGGFKVAVRAEDAAIAREILGRVWGDRPRSTRQRPRKPMTIVALYWPLGIVALLALAALIDRLVSD